MARARYTLLSISNNGIVRVESDISYLGHFLYFYRHFKTNTISQQRITQGNGSYSLSYKCCVNQKSTASIHVELFWQSLNCARPSASLIVLNILIRTLHISRKIDSGTLIWWPSLVENLQLYFQEVVFSSMSSNLILLRIFFFIPEENVH